METTLTYPYTTQQKVSATKIVTVQFWDSILLGCLTLFVCAVSVFSLLNLSLRTDESQSLWQSAHTAKGIIYTLAQDVHVPFYPLLLHFWLLLLGKSVIVARLLSLLFFALSMPLLYKLGRLALGRSSALYTCVLFAVSPFMNWFGSEIRMYSLFTFLALACHYLFLKIFKGEKKLSLWIAYVLVSAVGVYTHYFFWLLLFSQVFFYILYFRRFPRFTALKGFLVWLFLAAASLPWAMLVYKSGLFSNTQPIIHSPSLLNFFSSLSQLFFGFQTDSINTIFLSLWPVGILLLFLFLRRSNRPPETAVYLFISAFLPLLSVFIFSLFVRPIFVTRYFIFTAPALYLFVAWFLATYPPWASRIFKTGLVTAMALMLIFQNLKTTTPAKENYLEAARYLQSKTTPQDIVVVSAPFTIYPLEYYYQGPANITTLPVWNRYQTGPLPPFTPNDLSSTAEGFKNSYQNLWLLLSYNQGYESEIKKYFDENFQKISEEQFSTGLNLYGYRLRYNDPITIR